MVLRGVPVTLCLLAPLGVVAQERIDLESTFVGDKEQPSSISGNALDPVDRDVLARNIQFYDELALEGSAGRE
ncbi:MAG: hypothetical protein AMJ69_03385 [Gammaproteobacteria bacterium SG8_47]|nr:MAG: hypothetical protein AMJ69_03385 [Gammaproteobacteria bacterium SG8_47]